MYVGEKSNFTIPLEGSKPNKAEMAYQGHI